MKKFEKAYGFISFDYPMIGNFLIAADFKEEFQSDSDFKIRTQIIRERLKKIDIIIPEDFFIDFVEDLKLKEIKKIPYNSFHKIVWGEHWHCGR